MFSSVALMSANDRSAELTRNDWGGSSDLLTRGTRVVPSSLSAWESPGQGSGSAGRMGLSSLVEPISGMRVTACCRISPLLLESPQS